MKKRLRSIFTLIFFISFVLSCFAAQDYENNPAPAPLFQLTNLNDQPVSLNNYLGRKTVLLVFWTTWCPYCRDQLQKLNARYPELAKGSIEVLAINVGEPKDKVANFMKKYSLNLEVLLDRDSYVAEAYELMGVPTYFVINISGKIVSSGNQFPEELINKISAKQP